MIIYYLKEKIDVFKKTFDPPINNMGGSASSYIITNEVLSVNGQDFVKIIILSEPSYGLGDYDDSFELYRCPYCGWQGAKIFHKPCPVISKAYARYYM